ncbi:hypothetical protein J6590_003308 [Homalodisca vitripennis]|nr:hypothetical protein J6590_003308 [Homalodisca vitripennis]
MNVVRGNNSIVDDDLVQQMIVSELSSSPLLSETTTCKLSERVYKPYSRITEGCIRVSSVSLPVVTVRCSVSPPGMREDRRVHQSESRLIARSYGIAVRD